MSDAKAESRKRIANLFGDLARTCAEICREMGGDPSAAMSGGEGAIASDEDLDGDHGNPAIKYDPKKWKGRSFKNRRYSDCPPDYLAAVASFLDWSAANPKEGKEQYARFDRMNAARARGWAKRNAGMSPDGDEPSGPPEVPFAPPPFSAAPAAPAPVAPDTSFDPDSFDPSNGAPDWTVP